MRYKAVVFDMDGTMVDTRSHVDVLEKTYRTMYPTRPPLDRATCVKCYAMTTGMFQKHLDIPDDEVEAFWEMMDVFSAQMEGEFQLFDGIAPLAQALHQHGVVLGVNTSRKQAYMQRDYEKFGPDFWQPFFLVVTEDLVARPKPAPDSLLYFCEKAGLAPAEVLFVGDSNNDGNCARAAGCDFAVAGWGTFPEVPVEGVYHLAQPMDLLPIVLGQNAGGNDAV